VEFQPVSASRSQLALQKNRELHDAWLNELPAIGAALGATPCSAILTDATGVLIGATPTGRPDLKVMPVAHRVGVNLSEDLVGTTAPGLVARTGKQVSVLGAAKPLSPPSNKASI
jgi:transcriptional regulator of acetoin/glycerol metabolism